MKRLHLICRREGLSYRGVEKVEGVKNMYISGSWDIALDEAKNLIGGQLFLHASKTERSTFGGTVVDVFPVEIEDKARKNRVQFQFLASKDCKNVSWGGANHSMAWSSGIYDV